MSSLKIYNMYVICYIILNIAYYEVESVTDCPIIQQCLNWGDGGASSSRTPPPEPPSESDSDDNDSINACHQNIVQNFNGRNTAIDCFNETFTGFDKTNITAPERYNYKYVRYFRFLGLNVDVYSMQLPTFYCIDNYPVYYDACIRALNTIEITDQLGLQRIFCRLYINHVESDFYPNVDEFPFHSDQNVIYFFLQGYYNHYSTKVRLNVDEGEAIDPLPWCRLHHNDDSDEYANSSD